MNFVQAENFLNSLDYKLEGFDLKQINQLIELAELKPEKLKTVHIAGTNGKGSTVAFISSILREQGYKIGSYYSPHLLTVRERIRINNKAISEKNFTKLVEWFKPFVEGMKRKPSYFELLTAMAIKHFIDKGVDWVVAETGLGGRLDATNVLKGRVCVFTDISLEHTQFLGHTIDRIATEKAGIIKNNSTVIVGNQNKGIAVIKKIAKEKKGKVISPEYETVKSDSSGNTFNLISPKKIKNLKTGLLGNFQMENAALAASACLSIKATERAIREGLLKAEVAGRMHAIREEPLIILDSAHNPDAIKRLMENLRMFKYKKLIVVFGVLADKDVSGIVGNLKYETLIATAPKCERAMQAEKVNEIANGKATVVESVALALSLAEKIASENDLILVCGSNYVVAEALEYFGKKPSPIASKVKDAITSLLSST